MTITRDMAEPEFASFEQTNFSRNNINVTMNENVYNKDINESIHRKILEETYSSENAPHVTYSNLTNCREPEYVDRFRQYDSPDKTESTSEALNVPLDYSSENNTQSFPTSGKFQIKDSFVNVVNKLAHTFCSPPEPMIPYFSERLNGITKSTSRKQNNCNQSIPKYVDFRYRTGSTEELLDTSKEESRLRNERMWKRFSNFRSYGNEGNPTVAIDNYHIFQKCEEDELHNTITQPISKHTIASRYITRSNLGSNYIKQIREPVSLARDTNGIERNTINSASKTFTLRSLGSLNLQERTNGAKYSYATDPSDSELVADQTTPVIQETINRPQSQNNRMGINLIYSDIKFKPTKSNEDQQKRYDKFNRTNNNQISHSSRSYDHDFDYPYRRSKLSPTSGQSEESDYYSPPHTPHLSHSRYEYVDSQQYVGQFDHLQRFPAHRPEEEYPEYIGANSPMNVNYQTQNYWMKGLRSSATEIPYWSYDFMPKVQTPVQHWNSNSYPQHYSPGEPDRTTLPGSLSPLPYGSQRFTPTQHPPSPSFRTTSFPENASTDHSKRDKFVPSRYKSPSSAEPVEAYNKKQGFDYDIYQDHRSKSHKTQHVFTGFVGLSWPTIQKPEPTNKRSEEERMPVYTKPSLYKHVFTNDQIKRAAMKYTDRLKNEILKTKT